MEDILCFFDGSCEPKNPGGIMGIGACAFVDHQSKMKYSLKIPAHLDNSNNVAEYLAFEVIIDWLITMGYSAQPVTIQGDSRLVVMQMSGAWPIKKAKPGEKKKLYYDHAIRCRNKIQTFFDLNLLKIEWVSRDQNSLADLLSRQEKREGQKV